MDILIGSEPEYESKFEISSYLSKNNGAAAPAAINNTTGIKILWAKDVLGWLLYNLLSFPAWNKKIITFFITVIMR